MNHYPCKLLALAAFCMIPVVGLAQHDFDSLYQHSPEFKSAFKQDAGKMNLFDNEEILDITIKSDFKNLMKTKFEGAYQPAQLTTEYNDTVLITRNIEIKARGNFPVKTATIHL